MTTNEKGITLEEEGLGFDYVFKRLPAVSWYQLGLFLMSNWLFFCAGFTQVASVILQANADKYRCKTDVDIKYNLNYEEGKLFAPEGTKSNPSLACKKYRIDWTTCESFGSDDIDFDGLSSCLDDWKELNTEDADRYEDCTSRIFDTKEFENTVVSEWDLVCENESISDVLTAIFMAGLFIGVMIFGPLSDKIGRVNTIQVTAVGLIAVQLGTAFLPYDWTVWSYAVFRMLAGLFAIGGGTTGFVYIMEIIGTKWRTWFGVDSQMLFSLGYISLSFVGYLCRDWRDQMIVIALMPTAYLLIFFWLLPKSARFLFSAGRNEEAKQSLKRIATHFPKKQIDDDFINQVEYSTQLDMAQKSGDETVYSQADLFKEPGIRRITLFCMYQWFATTLVYYGLSFGAGDLGGSLLVNNMLNGLVEFVCYIFLPAFIDIKCIGRKYGVIITMAIGVLGCFLSAAFGEVSQDYLDEATESGFDETGELYDGLKRLFAIVGKFGVSGTFGVIYVHASELYPTPVRSIGVGMASACGRIGGVLAPLVNGLSKSIGWLPMVIFGVLGSLQVLSTFWMPETLGIQMLATLDQAEDFYQGKQRSNQVADDTDTNSKPSPRESIQSKSSDL